MGEVVGGQVGRARVVEVEADLVVVVDEDRAAIGRAVAVAVEDLADPAVAEIAGVL